MKLRSVRCVFLILVSLSLFVSCATVNQSIAIAPLKTDFPVSASKSVVSNGTVLSESSFKSSTPFRFKKVLKVPYKDSEAKLALEDELKTKMSDGDYSGITQLKVDVLKVDNSTATWIALEQNLGLGIGFAGLGLVGLSTQPSSVQSGNSSMTGLVVAGIGGIIYGLSYWHQAKGTVDYSFEVSGLKVKY